MKAHVQGIDFWLLRFDAYIIMPDGLDVYFMGSKIANIRLAQPLCSAANVAIPDLKSDSQLQITDLDGFTRRVWCLCR